MSIRKKVLILTLTLTILWTNGVTMPKVTVQPGSNLFQLAQGTGYTPEQLAAYNMIEDPNQIRAGQDIFIPYSRQEFESFAGPMTQPVQATTPVQSTATQPVVQTRQAQITDPPIEMWNTSYGQLSKQKKWFGGQDAVNKYKADNPNVQLTPAQEYVIANEGYLPDPYYLNKEEKEKGILTQGVGQTKRKGKDYIALGFPATYEDRIADLKRKMGADFVDAVEQNEPEKFKALADLAYRGDIGPLWAGHYKAGRLDDAYKEFWKRKKFGGSALDRVAKNSIILFGKGKGVPKGTKTSDGKKW